MGEVEQSIFLMECGRQLNTTLLSGTSKQLNDSKVRISLSCTQLEGRASFYADWMRPAIFKNCVQIYRRETFLVNELPEVLNTKFGVDRQEYGAVGASMRGSAALRLAERHPEIFQQVSALSPSTQLSSAFNALFGPPC